MSGLLIAADRPDFSAEDIEFFEKEIRPIFVEHCQECHGAQEPEAGLRLDARATILKGGDTGPAIVPGKPEESELILAVQYDPAGYQMPPEGRLPDATIARLVEWVRRGAPWPNEDVEVAAGSTFNLDERATHWSFQPLADVEPPAVQNEAWCRNPIDRFILAKLEEHGLTPARHADLRTWLRRASFDVIGLPPSPEEIEQAQKAPAEDIHAQIVNRLLASPHHGERWGRHWLDLVRYAESRGHEFDYDVPNPWHYRDYVIRALNADVPYDRFVVEHVAGDLLMSEPNPVAGDRYPLRPDPQSGANESLLATGFWFLGEWVHSPVDIRQEEAERFDNMIDVYSKAFLGLTVACARCHDHKFDPIRQKDYYALQGFLQSSSYRQARFATIDHNRQVAEQLEALRAEASQPLRHVIADLAEPVVHQLDKYLLAARAAVAAGIETTPEANELVIADFESDHYDGWTVTGDAFGTGPQTLETIAPYQGRINAIGRGFVNSHQKRDGGRGDAHTGRLTSPSFEISRKMIRMLVGGGAHEGKTCVNLLVGGKVVRTATGRNNNQMFPVSWDVEEFLGKTAQIEIVDDETGGWGNIGVDQIVQTSDPGRRTTPDDFTPAFHRYLVTLAREYAVNVDVLEEWVAFLNSAPESGPLAGWTRPLHDAGAAGEVAAAADGVDVTGPTLDELLADGRFSTIVDFRRAERILQDGVSFGTVATPAGTTWLSDDPQQPVTAIADVTAMHRDPVWKRLKYASGTTRDPGRIGSWDRGGKTLRTPSFEVTSGRIFALVRGRCRTYVAVDSHILINGPLHRSLVREHDTKGEWAWIEHDVGRYGTHRAHVELYPIDDADLSVAAVVQAEQPPTLPADLPSIDPLDDGGSGQAAQAAQRLRWAFEAALNQLLDVEPGRPAPAARSYALTNWMLQHPQLFGLDADDARTRLEQTARPFVAKRRKLLQQLRPVSPTAPTMLDASGEDEYVFIRGNWKKRGDDVPRRFLEVFDGLAHPSGQELGPGSGRLQLAMQMVDPQQTPILPRVIVNRIWLHYFGRGLVPTPDDFGHLGQPPSHPELLDWLAHELVASGWSLKHIHRLILLSSTYRMTSDRTPEVFGSFPETAARAQEIDPQNRLLSRMNVKRLEGESIRDAILAVSGRFDPTLYGPSVPVHLTPFMEGRGRPQQSGPVDGNGRRSLYISVRRNFPNPLFQAFDFPTPHSTIGRRSVSNVPAQALALMNNPLVIEESQRWGRKLLEETPNATTADRIRRMYVAACGRPPTDTELAAGTQFIEMQAESYDSGPKDPRVWGDYGHVIWNVKEFIFIR
ncbi:MAG: PSD1 and planctomycete cytochrome C domain-containing protein [Maioricimonas sp. JB049]